MDAGAIAAKVLAGLEEPGYVGAAAAAASPGGIRAHDIRSAERRALECFAPRRQLQASRRDSDASNGRDEVVEDVASSGLGLGRSVSTSALPPVLTRSTSSIPLRPVPRAAISGPRGFNSSAMRVVRGAPETAPGPLVGPGSYDTHMVGRIVWHRERHVSHPAQQQISGHRSPVLCTFGKWRPQDESSPPLSRSPGPGHYAVKESIGTSWQKYPSPGTSFARQPPVPGESRFGALSRGLEDARGGGHGAMDFFSG